MVRTVAMNVGEQFAAVCFARYGLHVERFAKTELRSGKTPDFPIFKADQFVLYCEAKHVQYDEWLDKRLEQAQPVEIVGRGFDKSVSEGRIREEKLTIDLYVWFDEWKGEEAQGSRFFNNGSKHYATLCALLGS